MATRDIASWMQTEHAKVERLADRLKEWVAIIPRAGTQSWLEETRTRFEPLRAHLIKHMAMEEKEGYLVSVGERRPTLTPNADRLQHEHHELSRIMNGIHHDLRDLKPDDLLLIRDCCLRITNLLGYVEHHEEAENMLITFVFTQDIGAKD